MKREESKKINSEADVFVAFTRVASSSFQDLLNDRSTILNIMNLMRMKEREKGSIKET